MGQPYTLFAYILLRLDEIHDHQSLKVILTITTSEWTIQMRWTDKQMDEWMDLCYQLDDCSNHMLVYLAAELHHHCLT